MMDLSRYIDHTILKAETTAKDIERVCKEALDHNFFGVCVNSNHISLASGLLKGSSVTPVAVVGFPLGVNATEIKVREAEFCLQNGAQEIDMVISIGHLKSKNEKFVKADIESVKRVCGKKILKVILETCLLTDEEKILGCKLSVEAGADFVKTSTGFSTNGATEQDILLMRKTVGPDIGVKASGGVRSHEDAMKMIQAGATRLGTSNGIKIMAGETVSDSRY